MTRIYDRRRAIALRKQGLTYTEIKKKLQVPKSTLSNWLSEYSLTGKQVALIEKSVKRNKNLAIEKIRHTKLKKREARLALTYDHEKQQWLPLNERELVLAGLFLYWGEGNKSLYGSVSLNNTDPQVLKFTFIWLYRVLKVPKEKIKVYLHLYSDMQVKREMEYWSKELKIPLSQFTIPYIKKTRRDAIDHKGFGHGTCGLLVNDVRLKERVIMAIKCIADYYSLSL